MKPKFTHTRCFSRNHMTMTEFAVWTFAREVSYNTGVFYASCTGMANQWRGAKKSNINNAVNGLVDSGWFVPLTDKKRGPDGKWLPRQYRVLKHEEWAVEHPGFCSQKKYLSVPLSGMDDEEIEEAVPPNGADRSKTGESTVPLFGRRFGSTSGLDGKNGPLTPSPNSKPKVKTTGNENLTPDVLKIIGQLGTIAGEADSRAKITEEFYPALAEALPAAKHSLSGVTGTRRDDCIKLAVNRIVRRLEGSEFERFGEILAENLASDISVMAQHAKQQSA